MTLFYVSLEFLDIKKMKQFLIDGKSCWLIAKFDICPESCWSIRFQSISQTDKTHCIAEACFLNRARAPIISQGNKFSVNYGPLTIAYGEVLCAFCS